ncbi:heterokaryon incompatibility protein-domain-containing protein [Xylariales sp. PMI_506]|nr:heterokaryon incompatibility protein-domain-containing protein [Xylariales sp. PMI_506]
MPKRKLQPEPGQLSIADHFSNRPAKRHINTAQDFQPKAKPLEPARLLKEPGQKDIRLWIPGTTPKNDDWFGDIPQYVSKKNTNIANPAQREPGQLSFVEWFTGRPDEQTSRWDIKLCGRCNEMDLKSVIDGIVSQEQDGSSHRRSIMNRNYTRNGHKVQALGHKMKWSKSCPLCQLMLFCANRNRASTRNQFAIATLFRPVNNKTYEWENKHAITELDLALLAITIDDEKDSGPEDGSRTSFEHTGYISWMLTESATQAGPPVERPFIKGDIGGRGRLIDPEAVDYEVVKSWIVYCREHHTERCAVQSNDVVVGFRVIDCDVNKIVPALRSDNDSNALEYLALSYVWGTPKENQDEKEPLVRSDGTLVLANLPLTVCDAIEATKRLGYRYLWIDRYCLAADDPVLLNTQLMQMDVIYARAQATLLATSGTDATSGLSGVSTTRRTAQPTARVGPYTLFATLPEPEVAVQESKWMTRGWTYQEAVLSTRKVFFTEHQVYFECHSMQCSEVFPPALDQWHQPDRQAFHTELQSRSILGGSPRSRRNRTIAIRDVWDHIAVYTRRQLSFDRDSLNGILGIFNALHMAQPMLRHFWGIPFTVERVRDTAGRPKAQLGRKWSATHCFLAHLLWDHDGQQHRRRQECPSWSWAGWEGPVVTGEAPYQGCYCQTHSDNMASVTRGIFGNVIATSTETISDMKSATVLGAETLDGTTFLSWDDLQRQIFTGGATYATLPRVLHVQAWTMPLRFKYYPLHSPAVSMTPGLYAYVQLGTVRLGKMTISDAAIYTRARLNDTEDTPANRALRHRMRTDEFTGLILGCDAAVGKHGGSGPVIILDRRDDGRYERIGMTRFDSRSMLIRGDVENEAEGELEAREAKQGDALQSLDSRSIAREGSDSIDSVAEILAGSLSMEKIQRRGKQRVATLRPTGGAQDWWGLYKTCDTLRMA